MLIEEGKKNLDLNGVEAHVLAGWQVHGLFQKYKKFKVSKAAVKTCFCASPPF